MSRRYRGIMYERRTDRVGGIIDVPTYLEPQVLSAAGIQNATKLGEVELHDQQVRARCLAQFPPQHRPVHLPF